MTIFQYNRSTLILQPRLNDFAERVTNPTIDPIICLAVAQNWVFLSILILVIEL